MDDDQLTRPASYWTAPAGPTTSFTDRDHTEPDVRLSLAVRVILGLGLLVVIPLAALGNSVVCFIVFQKPSMQSATNLLLANLALSGILLAVTVMPFALVALLAAEWPVGDVMCQIEALANSSLICEAVVTLMVITLDRYVIIVHRTDRLTPGRAKHAIGLSWALSFSLALPPLAGWGRYTSHAGWMMCVLDEARDAADLAYAVLYHALVFYVPLAGLGYALLAITWTVHQRSRRVYNQDVGLAAPPAVKLGLAPPGSIRVTAVTSFNCKMRTFKTIFLLVGLHALCWTPYHVLLTVCASRRSLADSYLPATVLLWLGYLNGAVNPIIYCWRIDKFREACRAVLPRSWQEVPRCPSRLRRRINPGAVYENSDSQQQTELQELQVNNYLTAHLANETMLTTLSTSSPESCH